MDLQENCQLKGKAEVAYLEAFFRDAKRLPVNSLD